eukprot:4360747-Amphidinium_carterae.2
MHLLEPTSLHFCSSDCIGHLSVHATQAEGSSCAYVEGVLANGQRHSEQQIDHDEEQGVPRALTAAAALLLIIILHTAHLQEEVSTTCSLDFEPN